MLLCKLWLLDCVWQGLLILFLTAAAVCCPAACPFQQFCVSVYSSPKVLASNPKILCCCHHLVHPCDTATSCICCQRLTIVTCCVQAFSFSNPSAVGLQEAWADTDQGSPAPTSIFAYRGGGHIQQPSMSQAEVHNKTHLPCMPSRTHLQMTCIS